MNIKRILTAFVCCIACAVPVTAKAVNNCGQACLIGEIGSHSRWQTADDAIEIDGDAKYEYTWNVSGDIEYLALCITPNGGYTNFNSITFPNLNVRIDEVWIDGEKNEDYKMNPNSADMNYFEDGAGITRIYLKNGDTPADINDLDGNDKIEKSIRVVFTVSGLGTDGTSNFVDITPPTEESKPVSQTTKAVITASSVSATTTLTPVPDIDKSAPTGDKNIGIVIILAELSCFTLIISKSGKKKE